MSMTDMSTIYFRSPVIQSFVWYIISSAVEISPRRILKSYPLMYSVLMSPLNSEGSLDFAILNVVSRRQ